MSSFEDPTLRWRETYFVMFDRRNRPTVTQMEHVLSGLGDRYEVTAMRADKHGRFESVTVRSPDDFSALDICFVAGEEVVEQRDELVNDLKSVVGPHERSKLKQVEQFDARLDILHFQNVVAEVGEGEDLDEMFDPSALLVVIDALVDLTSGIAIDPQSGFLM
jgi:hypothetical protein